MHQFLKTGILDLFYKGHPFILSVWQIKTGYQWAHERVSELKRTATIPTLCGGQNNSEIYKGIDLGAERVVNPSAGLQKETKYPWRGVACLA